MMRRCRPLLGTFVDVTADGAEIIDAAFAEIARVHARLSAHEPDSELSRINLLAHRQPVQVSVETAEVLERALHWSRRTGGLFDVVKAGAESLAAGRIPRHAGQPSPESAHFTALTVDRYFVRLLAPACIDLGGIAKGYAVDHAIVAMRRAGAARGLVNAGGDLFAFGPEPWTVAVADPVMRRPAVELTLSNEALATSALVEGSDAHLPSGSAWISVTVRAPSACDADALTKIAWAAPWNIDGLLDQAGARAFGMRADHRVENIGSRELAA